jgi:hypothetical protein
LQLPHNRSGCLSAESQVLTQDRVAPCPAFTVPPSRFAASSACSSIVSSTVLFFQTTSCSGFECTIAHRARPTTTDFRHPLAAASSSKLVVAVSSNPSAAAGSTATPPPAVLSLPPGPGLLLMKESPLTPSPQCEYMR